MDRAIWFWLLLLGALALSGWGLTWYYAAKWSETAGALAWCTRDLLDTRELYMVYRNRVAAGLGRGEPAPAEQEAHDATRER